MSDIHVPIYVTNQFTQPGYSYTSENLEDENETYPEYNIGSEIDSDNKPLTGYEMVFFTITVFLLFTGLGVLLSYTV